MRDEKGMKGPVALSEGELAPLSACSLASLVEKKREDEDK